MNDYILENLGCSIDEGNKENIYDKVIFSNFVRRI